MENKIVKIAVILNENSREKIKKTLGSITSDNYKNFQPIFFCKDNLKLEKCFNYIEKYYFKNEKDIYIIAQKIKADYIVFIKEGDTYSNKFCEYVNSRIQKEDYIISFKIEKEYRYNYRKTGIIRIEEHPDSLNIHLYGNVIKKEIFDRININEINFKYDIDINIMTKILIEVGELYKVDYVCFSPIEIYDDIINNKSEYYDPDWYMNMINNANNIMNYSQDKLRGIIKYVQYICAYMIKFRLEVNVNTKNKHIIKADNLKKYYGNIKNILERIDDEIILNIVGNKKINQFLLKLKNDKSFEYRQYARDIYLICNDKIIDSASSNKIKILLMNIREGYLEINGVYPFEISEEKMKVIAEVGNIEYTAQKSNLYSEYKCFGKEIYSNYNFFIKIKLTKEKKQYVKFFLKSDKSKVKLDILFSKPLSRLNRETNCYWAKNKYILNYRVRKKAILIMKNIWYRKIKRELKYLLSLLLNKDSEARKSGLLRILYWFTKPVFRKKAIWIFQDKIYKGGDNGEYLYKYCSQQKDKIKKYYILDSKCLDAKRFKKEKIKFVKYNSLYHKLLFLNSDIVFATHNNTVTANGFTINNECYFRDLFNYKSICIQHGLSVQYIPHLVNRINDDLQMFFLASEIERDNLMRPEYEYIDTKNILTVTGSPRYDGLKNNDKKIILITPTWRNYLAVPVLDRSVQRGYNNNFKKSDYFKIYNSLINNKTLIENAKKNGYKIVYLLHPATSSQINDYDKNDYVELIAATDNLNYEKILTESSLMVTDYSGVQFDFAYMYKPIVYFHPKELPPSYDEGEYKYETMSLGEIVNNTDDLVETLCKYMDNNCKIKDEYKDRIDKFFKYHDFNNCERIYNEVMKKFYKSR